MTNLFKIIFTFENPTKQTFKHLTNLISTSESLIEQKIYVAYPKTKLIYLSNEKFRNLNLSKILSIYGLSKEIIDKIKSEEMK
jgi:hypothetical protein